MKSKKVIILAGGFGSRLQSVLKGLPKPLADINGTPFLKYLFLKLIQDGYNDFILSLYYESDKIIAYVEELRKDILQDSNIEYCIEPNALGTGGAISFVVEKFNIFGQVIIVNADTLLSDGYKLMGSGDRDSIALVHIEDTSRYGNVKLDIESYIVSFSEKKPEMEAGLINAGIYNLNSSLFNRWDGNAYSIESQLFPLLVSQKKLFGITIESSFIDIGIPEDYRKFCAENNPQ